MRLIRLVALVAGFTGLLLGGSTVAVLSVLVVPLLVATALWSCSADGRLLTSTPSDL